MFSVFEKIVFVFRRAIFNAICDLAMWLLSEGWNISLICNGTIPFQYLTLLWQKFLSYRNQSIDQSIGFYLIRNSTMTELKTVVAMQEYTLSETES